jgi:uncharacterized protein YecE (DUF72 family)
VTATAAPPATHPVRVGCSGWQYRSWRGVLYPEGLGQAKWLQRYAEVFDTVEVNSTFYRLASRDAVARWVEQTPPDFVFALKASRYLIHMKKLRDIDQGIGRFYERIEPLVGSPKLGPILWQLPEWFKRDDDTLATVLDNLPPGRHPKRPWQPFVLTTDWTFVRFHYGHRGRRGNYSQTELREWAGRLGEVAREADVYAYFNNDWEGFAVRNALDLRAMLARAGAAVGSRA